MKKTLYVLLIAALLLALAACGKTKTLHCDNCNKEVAVEEDSNMTEEWTIYCEECNQELLGDDPLLSGN